MKESLHHRGPDDEGVYIDGDVGLGHCRLSIIDLDAGHQPMTNEDGSVWITYNGEIYNFQELRQELTSKGHSFRSRSDTEVIIHLYEELGPRCVERLRGMFAFCIWDAKRRLMVLARDRLGLKPLYYLLNKKHFIFSSELKGIFVTGAVQKDVNLAAFHAYLTRDYIPSPDTIFQGVNKLPPAHVLVCDATSSRLERYWKPDTSSHLNNRKTFEDYSEELEERIRESVKLRMISDVPIGVLLSGGVDSSTVLAMMAQVTTSPIKTFSIGTTTPGFNELQYAKMVADRFSTDHQEFIVEPNAVEILPKLVAGYNEPFADSSAVPTYYVSQMASQQVKVCLAGDGGDELFAGYDWYRTLQREERILELPQWARKALFGTLHKAWPKHIRGKSHLFALTQQGKSEHYAATKAPFQYWDRQRLLPPPLREAMTDLSYSDAMLAFASESSSMDYISFMQYIDLMTYLPEDLLVKVDRASMMHSLEVRLPLLDHELVDFAMSIPSKYKIHGNEGKYILKKLISRWVPPETIYRKKVGFSIPIDHWFKDELYHFTREILLDTRTRDRGYFQMGYVSDLLKSHYARHSFSRVTAPQIWNLLVFELWCREFLDKASPTISLEEQITAISPTAKTAKPIDDEVSTTNEIEFVACDLCGFNNTYLLFIENGFKTVKCTNCGLIYLNPRPTEGAIVAGYDKEYFASREANESSQVKTAEKQFKLMIRHVNPASMNSPPRVLELGSAIGTFLGIATKYNFDVTGADVSEYAAAFARNKFGVPVLQGTIEELGLPLNSFDFVAFFDVLSHVKSPREFFSAIAEVLKPEGIAFARLGDKGGLWKWYRRGKWSAPEHLYHFTRPVLKKYLSEAGLEIVKTYPAFDSTFPFFTEHVPIRLRTFRRFATIVDFVARRIFRTFGITEDYYVVIRKTKSK